MLHRLNVRPSPSALLALVAMFVALGGVSYAATKIDGSQIERRSIPGGKLVKGAIKNKQVKKGSLAADRLSAAARESLKGNQGPQGPAGPAGAQGTPGTALAYAQVADGTPSLISSRTSGFAGVTRPATGRYCLEPTPEVASEAFSGASPSRPTVASVEFGNTGTSTDELIVQPRGATVSCPAGTFEVYTYRNGALADDVAFNLIVP